MSEFSFSCFLCHRKYFLDSSVCFPGTFDFIFSQSSSNIASDARYGQFKKILFVAWLIFFSMIWPFCTVHVVPSISMAESSYLTDLTGSRWRKKLWLKKKKKNSGDIGNILQYICKSEGRIPGWTVTSEVLTVHPWKIKAEFLTQTKWLEVKEEISHKELLQLIVFWNILLISRKN